MKFRKFHLSLWFFLLTINSVERPASSPAGAFDADSRGLAVLNPERTNWFQTWDSGDTAIALLGMLAVGGAAFIVAGAVQERHIRKDTSKTPANSNAGMYPPDQEIICGVLLVLIGGGLSCVLAREKWRAGRAVVYEPL